MPNMNIIYESADTGGRTSGTRAANNGLKKSQATTPMRYRDQTTTNTANATSGSGSGGGTDTVELGGGYVQPAFDWAAYYAQLQAEAQARADAAYDRNMARIASAYNSASGNLKSNYNSTVGRLNASRDKSMGDVNRDAERSLREAYVNNMLTRKNLDQRLSAMGYNGGATESTMANLENEYGNSRTGINRTLNENMNNLNMTYGDNLAAAEQSYNSAIANLDLQRMQLEMQAENARQNAMESAMSASFGTNSSYLSALQAALQNQSAYSYDPTQATNDFVAGNVQQAQPTSESSDYAKWMAQQLLSSGNNANNVQNYLLSKGYTGQTIADIFRQLGVA